MGYKSCEVWRNKKGRLCYPEPIGVYSLLRLTELYSCTPVLGRTTLLLLSRKCGCPALHCCYSHCLSCNDHCHDCRDLWLPVVTAITTVSLAAASSPSVVTAGSRSRETASLFHLSSNLWPAPPFAGLSEVSWQESLGSGVFKLLVLAVYRRVQKNKCEAESQSSTSGTSTLLVDVQHLHILAYFFLSFHQQYQQIHAFI